MKFRQNLSDDEIKYIRLCFPGGIPRGNFNYALIAKEFGISKNMVLNVIRKKIRSDLIVMLEDEILENRVKLENRINDEYEKKLMEKLK